jgi:enterochelin esterase-like enzyme
MTLLSRRCVLAAAALGPVALRAQAAGLPGTITRHADVAGSGLLPRHIDVWRPDGSAGKPLPLLIMHDGQNLFDGAHAYGGQSWGVVEAVTSLVAAGTIAPIMIAGVWNSAQRWRDYVPADLLARLPAAIRDRFTTEQQGESLSPAYLGFLADTVVPLLRRDYAVAPGRVAIMGSSMGGLASLDALLLRPDVFGSAGCVSTHWPILGPKPVETPAISAAIAGYLDAHLGKPRGRKLWFDHGDQTLDAFYAPFQAVADARLAANGWQSPRDTVSRAYPVAAHNEASWRQRVADPLTFLFNTA